MTGRASSDPTSSTRATALGQSWSPPRLVGPAWARWLLALGILGYLYLALISVDVNWTRVAEGLVRAGRLFEGFLSPNFTARWDDIQQGMIESLTMTVTATVAGVILAVPFGLGAARNIAPWWLYGFCRGVIAVARALQDIIVAIFFVAMFGFGPFAGFLTLTVSTIGFLSKLLADDIEEIAPNQVEAVRATGAGFWQVIDYAVASQVIPRLVGLTAYKVDINFRESSVIGIVGAGGIGATLNTALDRYEFDNAAAILLIIIAIVLACEYGSGWIRKRFA
jgi:phosphonate transport system permease protein